MDRKNKNIKTVVWESKDERNIRVSTKALVYK